LSGDRSTPNLGEEFPQRNCTPEAIANAIEELKQINPNFHMDGASWTNHLSWVKGYENVLTPMNQLSALFHEKIDPLRQASRL
jgi:hypothetical protein